MPDGVDGNTERLAPFFYASGTVFSRVRGSVASPRPCESYALMSARKSVLSTLLSKSLTLSFAGMTFSAKLLSNFCYTFRSHVPLFVALTYLSQQYFTTNKKPRRLFSVTSVSYFWGIFCFSPTLLQRDKRRRFECDSEPAALLFNFCDRCRQDNPSRYSQARRSSGSFHSCGSISFANILRRSRHGIP